jgi:hypothetical protein
MPGGVPKAKDGSEPSGELETGGGTGTEVSGDENDDGDDEEDDDLEQGGESEQLTGIYLVDTDNARARCEYKKRDDGKFELECRAVVAVGSDKEFLAHGIAANVVLDWQKAVALDGEISGVSCDVAPDFLSQTCELKTETPTARVKVDLDVKNEVTKAERRETSIVLLPFSIGVAAGFVPNVPSLYKSVDGAKELALWLTDDEQGKEEPPPLAGFQSAAFDAARVPVEGDSLCSRGKDLYFTRGAFVFRLRDGKISLYAGANNDLSLGKLEERRRLALGDTLRVACPPGTDDLFLLDVDQDRIFRLPETGKATLVAETGTAAMEATSGDQIEGKSALGYLPTPAWFFALAPSGDIYVTSEFGIFRIDDGGKLRRVTSAAFGKDWNSQPPRGLSFDSSGRFYFAFDGVVYRLDDGGVPQAFIGSSDFDQAEPCPAAGATLGLRGYVYELAVVGDDIYVDQECVVRAGLDRVVKGTLEDADPMAMARPPAGRPGVAYANSLINNLVAWDGVTGSALTTLAGAREGTTFALGKPATESFLYSPEAVTLVPGGFIVTNTYPGRVLKVDDEGVLAASLHQLGEDEDGDHFTPYAVAVTPDGSIYVADYYVGLGRLGANGKLTMINAFDGGHALVVSPAGELYGAYNESGIYKLRDNGTRTLVSGTKQDQPNGGFAFGPDGDLYWTLASVIYRRDAQGAVTRIRGPGAVSADGPSKELADRGSDYLRGIAVANDGTIYFGDFYKRQLNALRRVPGKDYWVESTVFGQTSGGAECGAGKVAGEAAVGDFDADLQASLSLICAGGVKTIAIKDTCPAAGGSTRLAFTQDFDFGGNVVEVVLPCF